MAASVVLPPRFVYVGQELQVEVGVPLRDLSLAAASAHELRQLQESACDVLSRLLADDAAAQTRVSQLTPPPVVLSAVTWDEARGGGVLRVDRRRGTGGNDGAQLPMVLVLVYGTTRSPPFGVCETELAIRTMAGVETPVEWEDANGLVFFKDTKKPRISVAFSLPAPLVHVAVRYENGDPVVAREKEVVTVYEKSPEGMALRLNNCSRGHQNRRFVLVFRTHDSIPVISPPIRVKSKVLQLQPAPAPTSAAATPSSSNDESKKKAREEEESAEIPRPVSAIAMNAVPLNDAVLQFLQRQIDLARASETHLEAQLAETRSLIKTLEQERANVSLVLQRQQQPKPV